MGRVMVPGLPIVKKVSL